MRHGLWRHAVRGIGGTLGALAAVTTAGAFVASSASAADQGEQAVTVAPVVAGYERLKEAKADDVTRGEILLGELNCLQCHTAEGQKRILTKGAPDLSDVGARVTPQFLRSYLSNPHAAKPGATMPDVLHAEDPAARQNTVEVLTNYLASLGGPIAPARVEGNVMLVEQGRSLYHSVGCVACHAPEPGYVPTSDKGASQSPAPSETHVPAPPAASTAAKGGDIPAVPLGNLASKTTVDQLEAFLLNPLKARPHSRMPSSNLSSGEARAIAVYLLRDQLTNPQAVSAGPVRAEGVRYAYYQGNNVLTADLARLDKFRPRSEGTIGNFSPDVPNHRNDNFAVKFTGAIHVPVSGHYRFYLKSDDGSRLYIDGNDVVNNDGTHAPEEKSGAVDLRAGDHPIVVTFFQGGGGYELSVEWEGPQTKRGSIPDNALFHVGGRPMVPLDNQPLAVDAKKAEAGKQAFATLGCAACHTLRDVKPALNARPLAQLNAEGDAGCLAEHVGKGAPQYNLSADQRQALKAAIKADKDAQKIATPLSPQDQVTHALAAMNCLACHQRGNLGGALAARNDFFGMTGNYDLGEEGRFPPKLTGIGDKLLTTAIEQIVFQAKLHVRPWMATRMPRFNQEVIGFLPADLTKADGPEADKPPQFSEASANDGRKLVGTKGLGCVNCHGVGGNKSLGIPSIDLSTVHDRLRPHWFHALMVNPPDKNPGTRMPAFWPEGKIVFKDLGGGTVDGQIDAIWNYTSLGRSMALPSGIQPLAGAGMELIPSDEPIVHRTFMAEVGSRSILVGFPEMVHVAFDANNIRMAKAWRGRFFDAKGQWEGRGGQLLGPLGTDVIKFPPGPEFAPLDSAAAPWPALKYDERNPTAHFKGYVLDDKDRPIFQYVLDVPGGEIQVQEQPLPVLEPGKATLRRVFHLKGPEGAKNLHFLAAQGQKIEPAGPNAWTVDGTLTVRLPGWKGEKPVVRDAGGAKQLLLPVTFANGAASFEVEMSW